MMTLSSSAHGAVEVITLKGNVMGGPDGASLQTALQSLKENNRTSVVLDLSDVQFMNSSGLGLLISGLTTLRNAGGDVRLAGVGERIQSLLVITKLNHVFQRFDSVEDAVASYNA